MNMKHEINKVILFHSSIVKQYTIQKCTIQNSNNTLNVLRMCMLFIEKFVMN